MKERLNEILTDTLENWECDVQPETVSQIVEHLIENNVIVLPAKVGDKIYTIQGAKIKENIIERIAISQSTIALATNWHGMGYEIYTEKQIGKTVFLAKEDAEKHLKGMNDDVSETQ